MYMHTLYLAVYMYITQACLYVPTLMFLYCLPSTKKSSRRCFTLTYLSLTYHCPQPMVPSACDEHEFVHYAVDFCLLHLFAQNVE